MFTNHDIHEAAERHDGLSGKVLSYVTAFKRMIDQAKDTGKADLSEIEALVATDRFRRLGNFKEQMDWATYSSAITGWAPQAEWDGSFHRIAEIGNRVYLELEERTGAPGHAEPVNSMTVYEFGQDGLLERLYVYLQQAPGATPSEDSGWKTE